MDPTPRPTDHESPTRGRRTVAAIIGGLIGGTAGLLVGAGTYVLVTPMLEASEGLLREMQGLTWNLVPGLALLGIVAGVLIGLRLGGHRRAR